MKIICILFIFILSTHALADVKQVAIDAKDAVIAKLDETKIRRATNSYFALVNFSPFDLILPNKYGLTLGLMESSEKTYELEYLHGTFGVPFAIDNLGKMADDRLSLIVRNYSAHNSFNFSYGLSYHDFSVHLGDRFLTAASGGNFPTADIVKIQTIGFNIAVGNRWSFNHDITLGIDWVSWAQPLFRVDKQDAFLDHATKQSEYDAVDKVVKIASYFPRFSVLKIQFGMLF